MHFVSLPAMDGMPHGYCYLWQPGLVWLHAVSDSLIALAYFAIPISLLLFLRRRADVPFKGLFALFGLFIVACGTTHLLGVLNIWVPTWWLSGGVKALTAAASVPTAIMLYLQLPAAIALPSPTQLRLANEALERARAQLEDRVRERTADLAMANTALSRERQRYRTLVETSAQVVWTTTPAGEISEPQPSWNAFTGQGLAQSRGRGWMTAIALQDREGLERLWSEAVQSRSSRQMRLQVQRSDGVWRTVDAHVAPVLETDGSIHECVAQLADVTEAVEAQAQLAETGQQLQQAQRLESIGRLAGGVAHDFNNLLTVIEGTSTMLLQELPGDTALRDDAEEIWKASRRASYLTRQLLAFSRRQILHPQSVSVDAVVQGMQGLIQRLIGADVVTEFSLNADECHIMADPGQLEQILMNLVVNARDAMPAGGRLRVETSATELDVTAADRLGLAPGSYVLLRVADTGHGMDEVTRARIFEPFFTTKEAGKGTGLGLATVYGIVKQSGGGIDVITAPGDGTSFVLLFPRVDALVQAPAAPEAPGQPMVTAGATSTVLLSEDDAAVRNYTARVLRSAGLQVLQAANGIQALQIAREHTGTIDVLLTDMVMPEMNGAELASQFRALRPDAAVVFISGYSDDAITHQSQLISGSLFIAKPFTAVYLIEKLRAILRTGMAG